MTSVSFAALFLVSVGVWLWIIGYQADGIMYINKKKKEKTFQVQGIQKKRKNIYYLIIINTKLFTLEGPFQDKRAVQHTCTYLRVFGRIRTERSPRILRSRTCVQYTYCIVTARSTLNIYKIYYVHVCVHRRRRRRGN